MRNFVIRLIADGLADRFLMREARLAALIGAFALDDGEGDAVDEAHYIRAARLVAAASLDGELLGDVEHVVRRVSANRHSAG